MRTLSSALNTAYGLPIQRPVWLVEIATSTPLRLSSFATVTWNSLSWTAFDIDVTSLRVGALSISGNIIIGNADDAIGTVVLSEGVTDKRIRIWGYDGSIASPAVGDPVLVCDGVGAGASIGIDKVNIGIRDAVEFRMGPRAIVTPQYGFNVLLPAGKTITINGVSFIIQRGR